ncbi:oxygenase MpaB family protein [Nocardia fluminea]|uniref:oxygenase MpaB family protein n=1 Tax=Nocardia fluminea TaxID=134984 RepID=UPI0034413029
MDSQQFPAAQHSVRPEVLTEFRKHTASALSAFFAGAAFDQVALMPVAAAVDRTGRFAENFADRGVRSGFSSLLALWGDPADRAAEAEWLKTRHRDVRGKGAGRYSDVRYSALNPSAWIWVGTSGILVALRTFTYCTGTVLRPAEEEAAYQMMRESFSGLELQSESGKLPATLAEANAYYDRMVDTELQTNAFLVEQFAALTRLPLPAVAISPLVRAVLQRPWLLARPIIGHVIQVCSSQAMHPKVQALTGFQLRPRHDVEFAIFTTLLRTAWRLLPDRTLLAPLAYNRLQYEKLVHVHRKYALDDFSVPARSSGGCPI